MKMVSLTQRAMASSLVLILGACSATRFSATGPVGPQDLARYVLVVRNTLDGHATHAWTPIQDFDLTRYQSPHHARNFHAPIVTVALTGMECRQQYEICVPTCQASTRIFQVDKYRYDSRTWGAWRTGKWSYCNWACMQQLANCEHDADLEPVRFEAIEPAVDWVKENRNEILVGTLVVIAGVAFVAVMLGSGGTAGVALLPLVALASSEPATEWEMLAVKP